MNDAGHPFGGAPIATQDPEPVRRTAEIEDVTNLLVVHPIANRLVPVLARLGIPPNAVSVAGMAFGIAAGLAYLRYDDVRYAAAGFVLMVAWHVMDGADGQLARLTHAQSETGKILDGLCDYVTFAAVYLALAWRLGRHDGLVWPVAITAGLCHAVQSAAYEAQRQEYDGLAWGRMARRTSRLVGAPAIPRRGWALRLPGLLHLLYLRVQRSATGPDLDHQTLRRLIEARPERTATLRRRYRETFARPIRRWSVLSANTRTIGIFVCALLKMPLLYFVFEIVGFSLILVILTARQRVRLAAFVRGLGAVP